MATSSIKFGSMQINPYYLFFTRGDVFAMVVHNPITKGRKFIPFIFRYFGLSKKCSG